MKNNSEAYEKDILNYSELAINNSRINPELYKQYDVKRGLRDISGRGVLAGLTEISDVHAYNIENDDLVPCEGKLFYRGYNIEDIVKEFVADKRFGYEEVCYLLLFGRLPDKEEYIHFREIISSYRKLPNGFFRDSIMNVPGKDMMNMLARCVLTLYIYDKRADDISIPNIIRQSIELIAQMPLLMVYGYQSFNHFYNSKSLVIHDPRPELSTAENILHMLRHNSKYSPLEASILDLALVLHAEHGGGNNSSFTTHVVTSSATDTYSSVAASLGSLKGPRHGGANIKVVQMFENIKQNVKDWEDDEEISGYIEKILNKEVFDKTGLVYGMGHAVYSLSDPRALIFKNFVSKLAKEKGYENEYKLYAKIEEIAPKAIGRVRKIYKGVSANVDFYSGFVYKMLSLPEELYTPLFAVARISGWSAHRIEEIVNAGKIIRPAYKSVAKRKEYIKLKNR